MPGHDAMEYVLMPAAEERATAIAEGVNMLSRNVCYSRIRYDGKVIKTVLIGDADLIWLNLTGCRSA